MQTLPFVTSTAEQPLQTFDWGTLQWLANGKLAAGCQQTFGISRIKPGCRNPLHFHPNCEEILYVVSGCCDHSYDGQSFRLGPGSTIVLPAGVKDNLVNPGAEDVVCLISFSSPDRQTVFLEPL